jgi:hypothetical protein
LREDPVALQVDDLLAIVAFAQSISLKTRDILPVAGRIACRISHKPVPSIIKDLQGVQFSPCSTDAT